MVYKMKLFLYLQETFLEFANDVAEYNFSYISEKIFIISVVDFYLYYKQVVLGMQSFGFYN